MRTMAVAGALVVLGAAAIAAPVELYYFWAPTCPDCLVMKAFLTELGQEHPELKIVDHDVKASRANQQRMVALAQAYGLLLDRTPTVVVGEVAVSGIGRAVELQIREEVERCLAEGCASPLDRLSDGTRRETSGVELIVLLLAAGMALALLLLGP